MRTILLVGCMALLLCMPCIGMEGDSWRYPESPSVNGIAIGSKVKDVMIKRGRPGKTVDMPENELMPPRQEMIYQGMTIGVLKSNEQSGAAVWELEITSRRWEVYPGIRIGMSKEDIIRLIGHPYSESSESGHVRMWWLHPQEGVGFIIEFSGGKAIRIWMGEDWS